MRTEDLYCDKSACCGCELCAQSCPRQIIVMAPDEEGFLYPHIADDSDCIQCKRCITVCPMKKPGRTPVQIDKSFSFSLPEDEDLKKSASGGVVTAISREFVRGGGVVYGVAYQEDCRLVSFVRAETVDELEAFRGSKYVQARKEGLYRAVWDDLKAGRKVLFVGLPCEVSAIYHAVAKQDGLFTISLICHGPTSQKVHRDYCDGLPLSGSEMTTFSVRYKKTGWKPYYIHADYADGSIFEEKWNTSDYGIAFQYLKRPSCLTCRYKTKNAEFGLQSDMTVGDYHALKKTARQYNQWGVSQVSVQTEKGRYLASLIDSDSPGAVIPNSLVMISNRALHQAIPQRGNRKRFVKDYLGKGLHQACHSPMVKRTDFFIGISRKLNRFRSIKNLPLKIMRKI